LDGVCQLAEGLINRPFQKISIPVLVLQPLILIRGHCFSIYPDLEFFLVNAAVLSPIA
jgi:hypothetical protein